MHARPPHQRVSQTRQRVSQIGQRGNQIWLLSGTGEGPPLATALLARGWRVRVWVVSAAAARAYAPSERLELAVGALGGSAAMVDALVRAEESGDQPVWVVDATHPFASRISADLAAACRLRRQPLLRLQRPLLPPGNATILADLSALQDLPLAGRSLLLAIGARHLATAVSHSVDARHHARLLPSPTALARAMAAGLAADRVACLRPSAEGLVERALCRRWGINVVLCRRSGGITEALWHALTAEAGLSLLLLERPSDSAGVEAHRLADLLDRLGAPEWSSPGIQIDG